MRERFLIAVDTWPKMVAHLLLAIAGGDPESRLSADILQARRLATVLDEDPEVATAVSQVLLLPSRSSTTVPHVAIELDNWETMRGRLLIGVIDHAGSASEASNMLGVPTRWVRREAFHARRVGYDN